MSIRFNATGQQSLIPATDLSCEHLSAKPIYFAFKVGIFSFKFIGALNLSKNLFNTIHIIWNGCTLEQCSLLYLHSTDTKLSCANGFQNMWVTWGECQKQPWSREIIILIFRSELASLSSTGGMSLLQYAPAPDVNKVLKGYVMYGIPPTTSAKDISIENVLG